MISKEQADQIVANNKEFQSKKDTVDGYDVVQYRYRLASKSDFESPFDGCSTDANELRGLSFIKDERGHWRRFLLLRKFWEVNQTSGQMERDLKKKKIIAVAKKEDGSIIRFLRLPNGKVIAKSMFSLVGQQVDEANEIVSKSNNLKDLINESLDCNIAAIFELVSPNNQVVLKYEAPSLRLLQLRDEKTGEYLNLSSHPLVKKHLPPLAGESMVVDDLSYYLDLAKRDVGYEGYVLTFDDLTLSKVKLDEYHHMHGIIKSISKQEHKVIKLSIMDILRCGSYSSVQRYLEISMLSKASKKRVVEIDRLVRSIVETASQEVDEIINAHSKLDRKALAQLEVVRENKHRGIIMRVKATGQRDIVTELLCQGIIKEAKTGDKAALFIKKHCANAYGIFKKGAAHGRLHP